MKLQQLRYVVEIARAGLNVSDAAEALFTSQPGVSKQIKLLEEELGIEIFQRGGKRFTAITEAGKAVLVICQRMLQEADNLKRLGNEFAMGEGGSLVVATTHTQARYALPPVVRDFVSQHPKVKLIMHQGNPGQIAEWVKSGEADIGIATEALDQHSQLFSLPICQWSHCIIVPEGHALTRMTSITLAELARWPLITYDSAFSGGSRINRAFERQHLAVNVVLTALDADVIKTYVNLGLGLGIIADMAFDPLRDAGLVALPAGHLFERNTTRLALRRGAYLRPCDYDFITLFAPHLSKQAITMAQVPSEFPDVGNYQL
jgi:LysR family transcriptional regulator, cys regulon transcriptional activator